MAKIQNNRYDLEERCLIFAKRVRNFIRKLPKTVVNIEDAKQLVRSSGSIGANYIEANEAISKKDFNHRIKISRKESKETSYWLNLIEINDHKELEREKQALIQESTELMKIFSAIMRKSK